MLTFYYDDYRVHIDDTGQAKYESRIDEGGYRRWNVMNDPPAAIVLLAGLILNLVSTDVVRAEMAVAGIREELRVVTNDVKSVERSEYEARQVGRAARAAKSELAAQLKAAMGALQLARVSAVS